MKMRYVYAMAVGLPPVIAVTLPVFPMSPLFFLVGGFLVLVLASVILPFRKHPHGIFLRWTDPKAYWAMKLTDSEKQVVYFGMALAFGGYIAVLHPFWGAWLGAG